MTTAFPAALDTFANPPGDVKTNNLAYVHSEQHAQANDAIEAIEAKLGIGASVAALGKFLMGVADGASEWTTPTPALINACAFMAWSNGQAANVTGNGTQWGNGSSQVLFPTEVFDLAGAYNPSTGRFTAPAAGIYLFNYRCWIEGAAAGNIGNVGLTRSATGPVSIGIDYKALGNIVGGGVGYVLLGGLAIVGLQAGETIYPWVTVSGGSQVVDIGGVTFGNDQFSGCRIG